jgi:hypothetical protein
MQGLAANYLDHFTVDLGNRIQVSLAKTAPEDLQELDRLIMDLFGPEKLVCVYEALCVAADSELPHCAEVDEKVCPLDIFFVVLDFLGARVVPTHGGG